MKTSKTLLAGAAFGLLITVSGCGSDDGGTVSAATSSSSATSSSTASASSSSASSSSDDATPAMVSAADAFLKTLSADQKSAVQFDWSDTAQKQRWSNFPEGLFERAGLMWGNLTEAQQNAWLALMKVTLSSEGYDRVIKEMDADESLASSGAGGGQSLGRKYFWVALIGEPSKTSAWQWQWGGHHVTVNATVSGSELSLTPSFIGAQPATYDSDGTSVRPLGDIVDEAFALLDSLDDSQKSAAVLGSSSIDLVLGPGEDGKTIQSEGLAGSKMTSAQKTAFLQLIGEYGKLANDEDASSRMSELKANLDKTYFAWYGPTTKGGAAYFRVTGPTIVIEYSPQAMGGDAADHIHGIYRDPTNDYGAAITK